MGPQNAVVGEDYGTDMPQTQLPDVDVERQLNDLRKMAKFSKTAEFQRLKSHVEQKIEFYRNRLPNGTQVSASDVDFSELGQKWIVANTVIEELKEIIDSYERAVEVVKEDARRANS